ncbi:MAG: histidine--tRNA ligase [Bacilli bacterium]|jgi:histidyl-tRNA synthetase|nr:histidine--tRNA ligase [Bacilli bacterium]
MTYQKVKGTQDLNDVQTLKFRYVENIMTSFIKKFGYREIVTPIFENTEVFVRGVGDDTDIVKKEMYTFNDKSDRSLTLRPEGTAAVVRSFLENKMYANSNLNKLFYFGPMFRYERPQAGRFRQFYQFGIEAFGDSSPMLDADVINSAYSIISQLGIKNVILKINSIGDFSSRKAYSEALTNYFKPEISNYCEDCKTRIERNPLRILDCKVDKNQPSMINAPQIKDFLSQEAKDYFNEVLTQLDGINIPYVVTPTLVRGLDYYTDTVFEFVIESNDDLNGLTICGGGKYSELVKSFGGPDLPGIGYAFGIERLVSILDSQNLYPNLVFDADVVVIGLDKQAKTESLQLVTKLRFEGFIVEMDYRNTSMKPQFKLAESKNAKFIIIIGEEERNKNQYTIKNALTKMQSTIMQKDVVTFLKENIK